MKIRSNKELIYDSRYNKSAIIQLEITEWNYDVENNEYEVGVKDSVVISGETTQIAYKYKTYSMEEINNLFEYFQTPILLDTPFSQQLDILISNALLLITQQDPIYGSESQDWGVVVD